ncbi:MAG: hypothetical protein V1662_01890 [Candidatus Omnitrophota bacterium]
MNRIIAWVFLGMILTAPIEAGVPEMIRYQGKLTGTNAAPLNGKYNITLRLYNAASAGTLLWSETQQQVEVANGIFTVLLGSVAPLDLAFDEPYWLSIEVGNDGEMDPRQRITSVGYAYRAKVADSVAGAAGVPKGGIILWRGDSCPTGYTRVSELDGQFLVGGASYNPSAGGSNTHTHAGGTYLIPSHRHTVKNEYYNSDSSINKIAASKSSSTTMGISDTIYTEYSDSAALSGNSAPADSRPAFATVIMCEKE